MLFGNGPLLNFDLTRPEIPRPGDLTHIGQICSNGFFVCQIHNLPQSHSGCLKMCIVLGVNGPINSFLNGRTARREAMATHQHRCIFPEGFREQMSQLNIANQKVTAQTSVLTYFKVRDQSTKKSAHVTYWTKSDAWHDGKGNNSRRMAVDHAVDIRSSRVNCRVNESLKVNFVGAFSDKHTFKIEFQYVCRRNLCRRHVSCQKKLLWIDRIAHAHMPKSIENGILEKNPVSDGNNFFLF